MLALFALLMLLVVWAVNLGGDGGNQASKAGKDDRGDGAASSITPGPTTSEPVNSQRPGGRDEEEPPGDADDPADSDDSDGSGSADGKNDGSGAGDSEDGTNGGGDQAGLSSCRTGQAKVRLEAVEKEYGPGELPELRLTVENTSGDACKVNVHGDSAVLTIADAEDNTVWASDHCTSGGRTELRVPARGKKTHTVTWKRERSAAFCATPSGGAVTTGTYVAEVELLDLGTARTEFVLAKD